MASTIATLTKNHDGYKGMLTTLTLKAPIEFQRNARKANDKGPKFRVVATQNGFGRQPERVGRIPGSHNCKAH